MDDGCHVGMCWFHRKVQTENEEILLMEEIPTTTVWMYKTL